MQALLLLSLIATYRLSDTVMGVMANVFYIDQGFTKEQIASVSKIFGLVMTSARRRRPAACSSCVSASCRFSRRGRPRRPPT